MNGYNLLYKWIEQYLFFPNSFQKLISICLLPLTLLYCVITAFKRTSAKPKYFGIPVVSIGNLILGGSGKTPVIITLAAKLDDVCIILHGYGRKSQGLHIVSQKGKILCDVNTSGDEAMLIANSLPNATVIVSKDRTQAVLKAKELGCKIVFLDDGYRHHQLAKFDILIRPKNEPTNIFCLPSGGYKETKMMYGFVDLVLKDGDDFQRIVTFSKDDQQITTLPKKLLLLTAIANPKRILEFLPDDTKLIAFADHHYFTKQEIDDIISKYPQYCIITTQKDFVKLQQFNLQNLYLMNLTLNINEDKLTKLKQFYKQMEL